MQPKIKFLFILLAFFLLCLNVFAQTPAQPFKVEVSGHGRQAIVFIPGFACSGDVWKDTRAGYESKYTCFTFTMAGFAGVQAQPAASFRSWVAAIAGYLQKQHIEKPVIIGHSMGGAIALALAADYPNLVSKIIVVDALPCLSALMNPSFKVKENNDCSAGVSQMTAMNDEQFTRMQQMAMRRLIADTTKINQAVTWSVQSDRTTFGQMYCDFLNTDLRDKLAAIQCPALIMLEAGFVNYKTAIEAQYKELKTAKLAYAGKGLHFIMYDDTAWYKEQLTAFIK